MDSTLARSDPASFPVRRLLLAYSVVILGAGHGALPAGLLLAFGAQWILQDHDTAPSMVAIVIAGWLGVGLVSLTAIPAVARRVRALFLVGGLCLVTSVLTMVGMSDVAPLTAATSAPFFFVLGRTLWRGARASAARPGSTTMG